MAAHRAPPSRGFSRQEHWIGLPFPSLQCVKVKSESEVAQSYLTPSNPMDCSLPGSSVHGIYQAKVLEWVTIGAKGKELAYQYRRHKRCGLIPGLGRNGKPLQYFCLEDGQSNLEVYSPCGCKESDMNEVT